MSLRVPFALAIAIVLSMSVPSHAVVQDVQRITLTDNSGGSFFSALEVQAFSGGLNVAFNQLGAVATATTNGFGGTPDGANDGNISNGCCGQMWHGNGVNSALTITLPIALPIDQLKFFGRQGCCPERSDNFTVRMFDSGNNEVFSQQVLGAGTTSAFGNPVTVNTGPQTANSAYNVVLQNASATAHQTDFGAVQQTIDGFSESGGMGFFQTRNTNNIITYETAADIEGAGDINFMINQATFAGHQIARFRLSATDADRSLFSDGIPTAGSGAIGDTTAGPGEFVVLDPTNLISVRGATMTVDSNGIITVSGLNPTGDAYVITARNPLANVTGLRLEVLPGGDGFVGRSFGAPNNSNGNAVIHEFQVGFTPGGAAVVGATRELALTNATATFDQGGTFTIGSAINGVMHGNDGWGVFGGQTAPQRAVFQTDGPIDAERVVFELMHGSGFGAHKLQDFQFFYTTDANPTATDGSINWIAMTPDEASTSLDGTTALIDGNVIKITGSNAVPDNYQVVINGRISSVTGFRMDALLGANGTIGFDGSNGNIVLSEFRVFATNAIPEPASAALGLMGVLALALRRRRAA